MHYLKATAQDRSGNGMANTVILHFFQRYSTGIDESLKAFAHTFFRLNWFNKGDSWRRTLRSICIKFLAFKWDDHAHPSLEKLEQGVYQCAI